MPFGPYKDFADCTSDQKSKGHSDDSANKICGALQSKLGGSLLQGVSYDDCISQAKDFGHDSEAAKRICDSLTGVDDDAEDKLDQGIDEGQEDNGGSKAAWFDPSQAGIPPAPGQDEEDSEDQGQDNPSEEDNENDNGNTHDLGNDGPNMNQVEPPPDGAGLEPPEAYDVTGPTLDDNDHVDAHMDQSQKDTYDQLDDGNVAIDRSQAAKTESAQYAPVDASMPMSSELKQALIKKYGSFKSAAKAAQIEPFESNGKLFVKAFLLDTSLNQNAWGVSPQTLDANISTYIGKPLVLNDAFDHPDSGDDNLDHQLQYQELYRIGTVIDVVKNGSRYDAISEITDPYAVDAFHHGELPIYVSPQLYKQDPYEPDSNITRWQGTHLAIVKNPAYGVKVAQYKGSCTGSPETCLTYLKKASLIAKHGYGNCGYCNRKILLSAAASTLASDAPVHVAAAKQKVSSSLDPSEQNQLVNTLGDVKQETIVPKEPTPTAGKVSLEAALAENEKLKQKLLIANEAIKEHTKVNENLSQRVGSLEQERRKDQISTILSAAEFEQDGFQDKVNSLAKSSLPIDEIHSIFKPLVEAKSKVRSAASATGGQAVESKVSMKNATLEPGNNNNNGKPAWLIAREQLFKGGNT